MLFWAALIFAILVEDSSATLLQKLVSSKSQLFSSSAMEKCAMLASKQTALHFSAPFVNKARGSPVKGSIACTVGDKHARCHANIDGGIQAGQIDFSLTDTPDIFIAQLDSHHSPHAQKQSAIFERTAHPTAEQLGGVGTVLMAVAYTIGKPCLPSGKVQMTLASMTDAVKFYEKIGFQSTESSIGFSLIVPMQLHDSSVLEAKSKQITTLKM